MTKGITKATAKAVAAGNSTQQEDVIATANLSRKVVSDMLATCKVPLLRLPSMPCCPHTHTHTHIALIHTCMHAGTRTQTP